MKNKKVLHKINFLETSSILIGTVIGAGILGLPYVSSKIGFFPALIMLFVSGLVIVFVNLMFLEVVLRTPHTHQLPGYAGIYLNHFFKKLALYVLLLASYGSLLAYTVGVSEVLAELFGGSPTVWAMIFYVLSSFLIYKGLGFIKKAEFIMIVAIFSLIILISIFSFTKISIDNLFVFNWDDWIVPYGVMLFAYSGFVAIPQMREQMDKGQEKYLKTSILASFVFTFVVYALFIFIVLGVSGLNTTSIATIGLGDKIGSLMFAIGNVLAFFTMSTSFLTIGLAVKEIFDFDYGWSNGKSWLMAVVFPITFYLIGARNFINILSVAGGFLIGIQMVILILVFVRARKKGVRTPEFKFKHTIFMVFVLLIVLLVGIISTILNVRL